jgi:preprotein translocase subunit SecG
MALVNYAIPLIAFMVLANPATFMMVRGVAGNWVSNNMGRASTPGLFLHAIIFVLIVGFLMTQLRTSSFETRDDADDNNNKRFQENRIVYAVTA